MFFTRKKLVVAGVALFLTILTAPSSFSLSIWLPENFGEYYDRFDSRENQFVMVFGHFESVGDTEYEDVTDRNSDNFLKTGELTFRITAESIFIKTDPVVGSNNTERIEVARQTIWRSNPLGISYGGPPGPDSYLDIKFTVSNGSPTDYFYFFEIVNGDLIAPNYHYKFGHRLSPIQASVASRCNFFGECGRRHISRLRNLKLQW